MYCLSQNDEKEALFLIEKIYDESEDRSKILDALKL
jgi:hypothetical protein